MNSMNKRIAAGLVLAAGMLVGGIATATPITMDFDGLTPGVSVDNYYDGGCSKFLGMDMDCGGPDYGVVWNGAGVRDLDANQPSDPNFMVPTGPGGFLTTAAIMDVADGFDSRLSFYYSAVTAGDVSVFSGADGSGQLLTSLDLGTSGNQCGDVPCWDFVDLSFQGTAKSVVFRGFLGLVGFDNVTLGANPQAVPEPPELGMFGLGVLLIGMFAGMRKRARQN
jgi:hypothetical protein